MATVSASPASVRAWDLPTRLFHWTLVFCVVSAWISYELAEAIGDVTLVWHRTNGLLVLVLIVWRVLWGAFGSSTARFRRFVAGPGAVFAYLGGFISGRGPRYLGHNPAGALMVLALLLVLAVQGALGLFATDDNDLVGGPLYRLVSEAGNKLATDWHEELFESVLLPLIAVHILAIVLYALVKGERLVPAMITGLKPAAAYADASEAEIVARPMLRAGLCLVAAAIIVLGGILAAGGRLI